MPVQSADFSQAERRSFLCCSCIKGSLLLHFSITLTYLEIRFCLWSLRQHGKSKPTQAALCQYCPLHPLQYYILGHLLEPAWKGPNSCLLHPRGSFLIHISEMMYIWCSMVGFSSFTCLEICRVSKHRGVAQSWEWIQRTALWIFEARNIACSTSWFLKIICVWLNL